MARAKGPGWGQLVARLGRSTIDLVVAEIAGLRGELVSSGKGALRVVVLFAVAFAFAFWALGMATLAAVAALSLRLPVWGAALLVAGVFSIGAVVTVMIARSRWQSLDSPVATVQRRVGDHLSWWQRELGADAHADVVTESGADGSEELP